ncbi:MAG: glycosyltransferase [Planctomycetota bacterium]
MPPALPSNNPIRVMFLVTSMPVGGAETLLVNLVRRLDRDRFAPEVCCLKQPGPLGEVLAAELPVHHGLTSHKLDVRVLWRLARLMRRRQTDAVVTVGAGDKMFWGRLAAKLAGVKVIASALHSTGWPDGVGRLNRLLTPLTDAFIGVAQPHGQHLVQNEGFPAERVHVIPNGVDTARFAPPVGRDATRAALGLPAAAPTVGILAALRPEKNHELFLSAAARVLSDVPDARFVVIGDGPRRKPLEDFAIKLGIAGSVCFLGSRGDVPALLGAIDVLALTSHNEANPVSILEAMSVGKPVVATDVGSIRESVEVGVTGFLTPAGDAGAMAARLTELLCDPLHAQQMGAAGRCVVERRWSLDAMVGGYERLLQQLFTAKTGRKPDPVPPPVDRAVEACPRAFTGTP